MSTWQERLVEERDQVTERTSKLHDFIQSEAFGDLSADDQWLLWEQHTHMREYVAILNRRVSRL